MAMRLKVENLANQKLAYTNKVYISLEDFAVLESTGLAVIDPRNPQLLVSAGPWVFMASPDRSVARGSIGMNSGHRKLGTFTLNQMVEVQVFTRVGDVAAGKITIEVDLANKNVSAPTPLDVENLSEALKQSFMNHVFHPNQQFLFGSYKPKLLLTVKSVDTIADGRIGGTAFCAGQLLQPTEISWERAPAALIQLQGSRQANPIFVERFNFEELGIGGLQAEFQVILRRAFVSRIFPSYVVKQLGINHVRGMLLYGPPGCGKTLIARQIGKALRSREPKIVNGPEILDKYVGGSEEKIRELFADAEQEQKREGDNSMLHIIIFDEIDAICKTRGTVRDGTGVSDSVVNQLLSKIDGVDSLNNILIIGMTNRKDMIDDALLRPGRLEVHVEIGLPDEAGRLQILQIHTREMREHTRITPEAVENMGELATRTKNFTGAEIEGLIKAASSFALSRCVDVNDLSKVNDGSEIVVQWSDFERALEDVHPAFGASTEALSGFYANGIIDYGEAFSSVQRTLEKMVTQVRVSARTPLLSVLLEGRAGTGKTALAAQLATDSGFPFVRMISADTMIGMSEQSKCGALLKVFQDSYRSPLSVIFIDDIERIIDYTPIGPRFSNMVLQTLLVLLRKIPPENKKLFIIGTSSIAHLLEDLQLVGAFNVTQHLSELSSAEELSAVLSQLLPLQTDVGDISVAITRPIPVKQLLMVTEMARQDNDSVTADRFLECLHTCGY